MQSKVCLPTSQFSFKDSFRQIDRQTDRQTDRQIDRYIDRQIDRWIDLIKNYNTLHFDLPKSCELQ